MNKSLIEQVKAGTDIVAVISEHVSLQKRGKSFWGLCPFHAEKTPSFQVDPTRQMFKCFGCDKGGDAITFLMEIKGLAFLEALKELAQRAGISYELEGGRVSSEKKSYYEINKLAVEFYKQVLYSQTGKHAREYLAERGLHPETIGQFSIGYAPDSWDGLLDHFKRKGVSLPAAERLGLLLRNKSGKYYDRFRARIIFPIKDLGSEVVGFGGRVIAAVEPKYINSPESPVFEKRKILYNLSGAKGQIRTQGVVLVEGYMDVVSLFNAGFKGAVATLGTALSEDHVRLLKRFSDDITLVFDGDSAGRKAMLRSIEPFLDAETIPKVVILPPDKDPDDIAREDIGLWREMLAKARSIWDFMIDESFCVHDPSKLDDQTKIIRELGPIISRLHDQVVRDLVVQKISVKLGIGTDVLARHISSLKSPTRTDNHEEKTRDLLEDTLLRLMLFDDDAIRVVNAMGLLDEFSQTDVVSVVEYLLEKGNRVLDDIDCPDHIRRIASRHMAQGKLEGDRHKALLDAVSNLKLRALERELHKFQQEITQAEETNNTEQLRKLLQEKRAMLLAKKNIHNTVMEVLQGR